MEADGCGLWAVSVSIGSSLSLTRSSGGSEVSIGSSVPEEAHEFSSGSVSKDGKCRRNSLCSFSGPVGELGTMSRVLVKLFWLGATKSIELLETNNTGNLC